jgi:hypothetical protein
MLVCVRELLNYRVKTKDGFLGKICDLYFDCDLWTINYLVIEVDTLYLNQLPFSTTAITAIDQEEGILFLDVTETQIENAPLLGEQVLLSRQKEVELHNYYQWSPYWLMRWVVQREGNDVLYYRSKPIVLAEAVQRQATATFLAQEPSLQSINTLFNCTFAITSGHQASVMDALVNLRNWRITNLVFSQQSPLPMSQPLHTSTLRPEFPVREIPLA